MLVNLSCSCGVLSQDFSLRMDSQLTTIDNSCWQLFILFTIHPGLVTELELFVQKVSPGSHSLVVRPPLDYFSKAFLPDQRTFSSGLSLQSWVSFGLLQSVDCSQCNSGRDSEPLLNFFPAGQSWKSLPGSSASSQLLFKAFVTERRPAA